MTDAEHSDNFGGDYWDVIGNDWQHRQPHQLWRSFTDRLQIELLKDWLGSRNDGHILKTDLFDEVAGGGIVPWLGLHWGGVTGIDISSIIAGCAAARNPEMEVVVADVRNLPFTDESFDAIFSGSTLDHFPDCADISVALHELIRTLRPGGQLLLIMDNPLNPFIRLRNGLLRNVLRRSGIIPYATGKTLGPLALQEAVRDSGLMVLEMTAILHCPRVLAVALSVPVGRCSGSWQEKFIRMLMACERLKQWPTRYFSGHFIAIHATKPL